MFSARKLDDFVQWLMRQLPESGDEMRSEFEKKLRAGLESALKKMNLVSREEYDVQTVLLDRLRKKLDALERRLDQLEKETDEAPSQSPDRFVN